MSIRNKIWFLVIVIVFILGCNFLYPPPPPPTIEVRSTIPITVGGVTFPGNTSFQADNGNSILLFEEETIIRPEVGETDINVHELNPQELSEYIQDTPPPDNREIIVSVEITPNDMIFSTPATVKFDVSGRDDLSEGDELEIYSFDERKKEWLLIGKANVNHEDFAVGQIGHTSVYAVMTKDVPSSNVPPASTTEAGCSSEDVLCVGLVTDVGKVDDKSFNQSAWEGVKQAEVDLGALIQYVETKDAKDYAANIDLFVEKNYDVIVTVGFAMGQATVEKAAKYPEINFIGVDQWQAEELANVTGLLFPEDKAGFMAGALAAQLSETGIIAAVLGTDLVPPVVAFKEGYEAGALYINPDIYLISIYHPGGMDIAFVDPEWGAASANLVMDEGADVVFGAGGKTGNGALIEVASRGGVYCIGVDTDQWETVPEAHPCLVSSAMKLITPGVFELIKLSSDGAFPKGNFFGPTGLASFHDFDDSIPQAIKDKLAGINAGLEDGSISTGY